MTLRSLFSSRYIIIFCFLTTKGVESKRNEQSAITRLYDTDDVYKLISTKEPHLTPDTTTSDETKKRICLSLTKNAYFNLFAEEDPVEDMDEVYKQLVAKTKYMKERNYWPAEYLEKFLEDNYEIGENGRPVFTYRSQFLPAGESRTPNEFVFPCFTRIRATGNYYLYLVSDPYNINVALDVPTDESIQARILYAALPTKFAPTALAEEAAMAFAPPEYTKEVLEDVYLQLRESRSVAPNKELDPVCGLKKSDKVRVCACVMNSPYFAKKVQYNPGRLYFDGKCKLDEISFLSDKAKTKPEHLSYKEWMLSCPVSSITDPGEKYTYRLSRAYQSHHVWVHQYNEENDSWNIDSIGSQISVIVDDGGWTAETGGESSPPSLVDLLKTYKPHPNEETLSKLK